MKKLLFTLCLLATSVATWADRWTAPSSTTYPNETPLYVTVSIDEELADQVPTITEIAAFIDGECRAQATQKTGNVYILRVRGGDADRGKAITIKALYNGLVYKFARTETFDGEAETHDVPLALQLSPLVGIGVDEDPIEMVLNGTYNLADHMSYQYGSDRMPTTENGIDQTETPLTVSYDTGNSGDMVSIDNDGVMTAHMTGRGSVGIWVYGPNDETGYAPSFSCWVNFMISLPTVTQIVVNPTELTVYVGDNLQSLIREGKLSISMLPAEADQSYRFTSQSPVMPWDANYGFTTAGDFEVQVVSTANPELDPVTVTFHVKEPLSFTLEEDAYVNEIGMVQPKTFNVYMNTNDGFDASLLTIQSYHKTAIAPFTYEVSELQKEEDSEAAAGRYYVTVTMTGRYVGPAQYNVLYNGEPIADVFNDAQIVPEVALNTGWQWMSPYAYEEGNEVSNFCVDGNYQSWVTEGITEMRTQEGLLYVDAKLGAFGDIIDFNFMNGMYKVKSKSKRVLRLATNQNSWQLAQYNDGTQLQQGYNWVIYPFEFALGLDEVSGSLSANAQEGDQIISKDGGFAEFTEGAWVHSGFTFQPGEGYMYYRSSEESGMFQPYFNIYENTPQCYQESAPVKEEMGFAPRKTARDFGWQVESARFADNMTIVASLGLPQGDRYVIGAFVGDECRGVGSMVRDGIAFISVAGKSGEKVSFRLLDTFSGENFDIHESLTYSQKAGSMKAPVNLTSEGATAIETVRTATTTSDKAIYDLNGRRVERPAKGIYIVNGKKVVF